jgi:F-type H+-transporting ATPase subunit epsilon
MTTFHLIITSVAEPLYDGAVVSATIPGSAGEMTILPHHEALVTTLKPGTITVRMSGSEEKIFEVTSGVVECSGNRVVILL